MISLLDKQSKPIIIRRARLRSLLRWCWNWQTGMVEGHVPQGVEVQVLSSAPIYGSKKSPNVRGFVFLDPKDFFRDPTGEINDGSSHNRYIELQRQNL